MIPVGIITKDGKASFFQNSASNLAASLSWEKQKNKLDKRKALFKRYSQGCDKALFYVPLKLCIIKEKQTLKDPCPEPKEEGTHTYTEREREREISHTYGESVC